jgi:hypothetical protein
VEIDLHGGKGPTYGYIVAPSIKDAVDPGLPTTFLQNARYIRQTEHRGIYTFEDTR